MSPDASFNGGSDDGFVAKFDQLGKLKWSRYYGGEGYDGVFDIACQDPTSTINTQCFFVGHTTSAKGIATNGAYDSTLNGGRDGFLAKINSMDGSIAWATYYGGSGIDTTERIAVDQKLNIFISGSTNSTDSMATLNAYSSAFSGEFDAFLAKFTSTGVRQIGTYFGTAGDDEIFSLALDSNGNVYATGAVTKPGNVITQTAYDNTFNGPSDGIFSKFNQMLVPLRSSYYGGNGNELQPVLFSYGGIAVDKDNHIYIFGSTDSADSIAKPGAHKILNEKIDTFIAEFAQ